MLKIDSNFFNKHQRKILFVANNIFLRWILGLHRLPEAIRYKRVERITPASIHFLKDISKSGQDIYEGSFFSNPRFAEALAYNITPFVYLANLRSYKYEWRFSPVGFITSLLLVVTMPKSGLFAFMGTVTDYYSGAGDGAIVHNTATFSGTRNATTGSTAYYTESSLDPSLIVRSILFSGQYYSSRGFFPTDTSGLGSGATITSAEFKCSINVSATYDTNSDSFALVQTSQASTSSLSTSDFDALTMTSGGAKTIASFSVADQYWTWTLNSTGLGWINKTGITMLGMMSLNEINNTTPTGLNQLGGAWYLSDNTGTSRDPYLSVTYTTSVDATVTPSALSGTFAIPAYTPSATRNVTITPNVVDGTFGKLTPTITGGATQSPSTVTGTFAIPAYAVSTADTTVFPTTVGGTFSIPAYTPSGVQNIEVLPSIVTATFAIPAYAVSVTASPTIALDTVNATFSILTYFVQGDFWNNKFSDSSDSWSNKY